MNKYEHSRVTDCIAKKATELWTIYKELEMLQAELSLWSYNPVMEQSFSAPTLLSRSTAAQLNGFRQAVMYH